MNILVVGLFFSGSSAVLDLLKEYASVGFIPNEFDEFRRVQLLGDILAGRTGGEYPSSGIKRFLASKRHPILYKYIDLKCDYKSDPTLSNEDKDRFQLLLELDNQLEYIKLREQKMVLAKEYLKQVRNIYAPSKPYVLFDQPIFFGAHEGLWEEYFSPYKLIIVKRDIKDQIADLIKHKVLFLDKETPTRSMLLKYGDGRGGAIKYEVDMILERQKYAEKIVQKYPDDVLYLSFEDLIQSHKQTKKNIETFLEIEDTEHLYPNKYFNRGMSSQNIGIYKDYLTEREIRLINTLTQDI